MPVFSYKASTASGQPVTGTLTADTPAAGRQILRARGVQVLDLNPVRFQIRWPALRPRRRKRDADSIAEFARQLSLLIRSGVAVVPALDVLTRQGDARLIRILCDVRESVAAGAALATALEKHPRWFDRIFCSAVHVGQASGRLDGSLRELADHLRERCALRNTLFNALAYPVILTVLGIAVVGFLMSYVVPQLMTVLEASGRQLPASTAALKTISDLVIEHWMLLALLGPAALFATGAAQQIHAVRCAFHRAFLKLPAVGMLLRKSAVAQFAQTMSLLLRSGVSFLEGVRLVRSSVQNEVLKIELSLMEAAVERGSDVAPTMHGSRIFPPLVAHLVHVGQTSGELVETLDELRLGYQAEVRLAVGRATAILEPLMIIVMACLIGFVVFATMTPLLEVMRTIH